MANRRIIYSLVLSGTIIIVDSAYLKQLLVVIGCGHSGMRLWKSRTKLTRDPVLQNLIIHCHLTAIQCLWSAHYHIICIRYVYTTVQCIYRGSLVKFHLYFKANVQYYIMAMNDSPSSGLLEYILVYMHHKITSTCIVHYKTDMIL